MFSSGERSPAMMMFVPFGPGTAEDGLALRVVDAAVTHGLQRRMPKPPAPCPGRGRTPGARRARTASTSGVLARPDGVRSPNVHATRARARFPGTSRPHLFQDSGHFLREPFEPACLHRVASRVEPPAHSRDRSGRPGEAASTPREQALDASPDDCRSTALGRRAQAVPHPLRLSRGNQCSTRYRTRPTDLAGTRCRNPASGRAGCGAALPGAQAERRLRPRARRRFRIARPPRVDIRARSHGGACVDGRSVGRCVSRDARSRGVLGTGDGEYRRRGRE